MGPLKYCAADYITVEPRLSELIGGKGVWIIESM